MGADRTAIPLRFNAAEDPKQFYVDLKYQS
jgi:hypothetical protein